MYMIQTTNTIQQLDAFLLLGSLFLVLCVWTYVIRLMCIRFTSLGLVLLKHTVIVLV